MRCRAWARLISDKGFILLIRHDSITRIRINTKKEKNQFFGISSLNGSKMPNFPRNLRHLSLWQNFRLPGVPPKNWLYWQHQLGIGELFHVPVRCLAKSPFPGKRRPWNTGVIPQFRGELTAENAKNEEDHSGVALRSRRTLRFHAEQLPVAGRNMQEKRP